MTVLRAVGAQALSQGPRTAVPALVGQSLSSRRNLVRMSGFHPEATSGPGTKRQILSSESPCGSGFDSAEVGARPSAVIGSRYVKKEKATIDASQGTDSPKVRRWPESSWMNAIMACSFSALREQLRRPA